MLGGAKAVFPFQEIHGELKIASALASKETQHVAT
jgi:hypothetical protein